MTFIYFALFLVFYLSPKIEFKTFLKTYCVSEELDPLPQGLALPAQRTVQW